MGRWGVDDGARSPGRAAANTRRWDHERFHDNCRFRRAIEGAHSNSLDTRAERRKYRERRAEFLTLAFDALYRQCIQTSSIFSTAMNAAAFPACLLGVHALGRRYDPERATETRTATSDGDMTPKWRCHPHMSRPPAPCRCRTRVNRLNSSARPTGVDEGRSDRLNRERPHFRRFAAPKGSLPVNGIRSDDLAGAIDDRCCHRARRCQGFPSCARRLRRP